MIIINAEDQVLGRVAAFAAKKALLGDKVEIVNCEKAIVTGTKENVLAKYKRLSSMGVPRKGPYLHRKPDRIVRRTVRGMLSYKNPRGAEAYSRVMTHVGVPKEFEGKENAKIPKADISKLRNLKYMTMLEISRELGARV